MKTTLIIFLLSISTGWANDKYEQAMLSNIDALYKAQTIEALQQSVNALERIGGAEKNKWEPFYYASFGYVMMATREQDGVKKDGLLDKAAVVLEKAAMIKENESEIVAMEGFIYMIRVTVDPATRGQQYSGLAMQTFGKALGIDPENPRAMSLLAQMQFGTAQFFKASTADACANASKSIEKFDTFQSDNVLVPRWGKESAIQLIKRCNPSGE